MTVIAGVDGCKSGWLCVWKNTSNGQINHHVFDNAHDLIHQKPRPLVIAIDIPIGLTDAGCKAGWLALIVQSGSVFIM
jgi:predicted RNase H-like nuclease